MILKRAFGVLVFAGVCVLACQIEDPPGNEEWQTMNVEYDYQKAFGEDYGVFTQGQVRMIDAFDRTKTDVEVHDDETNLAPQVFETYAFLMEYLVYI